ncbi:MAG: hypothetical protein H0W72_06145 [Planctomycetes bacterium]|nr:hypothetical protein [Planctomycetota bacterium]
MHRRGSLLIIVSGMCAVLASLAIAFLSRARSDIDEAALAVREAQSRIMLSAACCYILEAAPAATHDPVSTSFFPGFGALGSNARLIGRFPMHALTLPPHAVSAKRVYRPYDGWRPYDPYFLPAFRRDPTVYQTVANPLFDASSSISPSNPDVVVASEARPAIPVTYNHSGAAPTSIAVPTTRTMNMAWFRVYYPGDSSTPATVPHGYRQGQVAYKFDGSEQTLAAKARFIVTCGSGASLGFRDWAEIGTADRALFGNDPATFATILAGETRLWFAIEWTTINVWHDPAKPSSAPHPPMFSDSSDPAYSPNTWVLPPDGPTVAPPDSGTDARQYVIPWDPVRSASRRTNDFTKLAATDPHPAEQGFNHYPQSLESDAFRYHGRIKKITRLESAPGSDW